MEKNEKISKWKKERKKKKANLKKEWGLEKKEKRISGFGIRLLTTVDMSFNNKTKPNETEIWICWTLYIYLHLL